MVFPSNIQASERRCEKQWDWWVPGAYGYAHLIVGFYAAGRAVLWIHPHAEMWMCCSNQMRPPRGDSHLVMSDLLYSLSAVKCGRCICASSCVRRGQRSAMSIFCYSCQPSHFVLSEAVSPYPGDHRWARLADLGVPGILLAPFCCRTTDTQPHLTFMWVLRSELSCFCLSSSHFTAWAVPQPSYDPSASVPQVLKLQVCPTTPGFGHESIHKSRLESMWCWKNRQ